MDRRSFLVGVFGLSFGLRFRPLPASERGPVVVDFSDADAEAFYQRWRRRMSGPIHPNHLYAAVIICGPGEEFELLTREELRRVFDESAREGRTLDSEDVFRITGRRPTCPGANASLPDLASRQDMATRQAGLRRARRR